MNHYFEYSNINQNKFDPCVMQMCSIFIVYNTVHYVLKTLFSWLIYQYKFSIRVNYMHSSEKKIMKVSQPNKQGIINCRWKYSSQPLFWVSENQGRSSS